MPEPDEQLVLCARDGTPAGTAPKASAHHRDTPLHLAFSCYLFDPHGRVLLTRRAYDKPTFPGMRTNSCCGHPRPGEGMRAAIRRRLLTELGIIPVVLDLILPTFRYRATAPDGIVENELCPVYRARTTNPQMTPDPTEVAEAWWQPWAQLATQAHETDPLSPWGTQETDPLSPWGTQQVQHLNALGPDPFAWATGEQALLPAAASP
jgi:isopentenyl-diphosphate delta-isomerase